MGTIDFGLLDRDAPAKVANAFIPKPQDQLNQLALQKALRENQDDLAMRQIFQQNAGNLQNAVPQLAKAGLGQQSLGLQSKLNEQDKAKVTKAIETLSQEENLDAEKLQQVIGNYLFTEKLPLRDDIIGTMNTRPTLKERGTTAERITNKIIHYIETFISGITGEIVEKE